MVGIYRIVNMRSGKSYYGSSADIGKRFAQHLKSLRTGTHHNTHLQRAWFKHGEDAFTFEVVEECETEQLLAKEQHYLDSNEDGYNIGKSSSGGDNISNNPNRAEIVTRIKKANQARLSAMTQEERSARFGKLKEKNPNWKGGSTFCKCGARKDLRASTCSKCRDLSGVNNPFYGKTHTEGTRQTLREYAKGRTTKPSNSKKVSADGVIYETAAQAAKAYNISRSLVNHRCNSSKYNWMFVT